MTTIKNESAGNARVLALIGAGHFMSHFYALCLPPLFLVWQKDFGITFAELGLSIALMGLMSAALQTPVGFLVDRFGAKPFLIAGTLVMSIAIGAMGFATAFWQILILAAVSGVGNSVFHPADYSILAGSIPPERMGRSFAIHTFTGNMGFAAAPPTVTALLSFMGWREALLCIGLAGAAVAVAIVLNLGSLREQTRQRDKADNMSVRALVFDRTLVLFLMFFLLGSMAGGGIQAWLITILHEVRGFDLATASMTLTAYLIGSSAGVLCGGWVADRSPKHLALIVGLLTAVSAALTLTVGLIALGGVAITLMMFVAGVSLGASRTPRDVMLKDVAPPGQIGKVFGFVSAGLPLGNALTPLPFGFLIDHGHPNLVLVGAAALLVLSIFCVGTARASSRKRTTQGRTNDAAGSLAVPDLAKASTRPA